MTGRPAALSALALASTARVADSVMAESRADTRRWAGAVGGRPASALMAECSHGASAGWRPVSRAFELNAHCAVHWPVGAVARPCALIQPRASNAVPPMRESHLPPARPESTGADA